jgi:hypothetical protein
MAGTKEAWNPRAQPVYWFVLLETAMDRGDLTGAANAQRELARLGVHVRYGRPRRRKGDQ